MLKEIPKRYQNVVSWASHALFSPQRVLILKQRAISVMFLRSLNTLKGIAPMLVVHLHDGQY